jgi:spore coat polysaccharide biosynthesis predicted glycosyltransferase SpsG
MRFLQSKLQFVHHLSSTTLHEKLLCGDPRFALSYIKENGQTDEEEYPYAGYQRTCEYSSDEKVATISEANTIMTNRNETLMRDIVASIGPV